jgi:hypothetical protein
VNTYYKRKKHASGDGEGKYSKYSDVWMTPTDIAHKIVDHFKPSGVVLEPAAAPGDGGFISHPAFTDWCEVRQGKDFFDWTGHADWIITNPPYSIVAQFLEHAFRHSNNVVFGPVKIDALGTGRKRFRMPIELGFYVREIILLPKLPPPMPQTGFQYFVIHWSKEEGDTKWTNWTDYKKGGDDGTCS